MASPSRKKKKRGPQGDKASGSRRSTSPSTDSRDTEGQQGGSDPVAVRPGQSGRETIESVIVAVILAFLFRAFVAEAFIIPTGSMAPTLQGRHLDVKCDGCGFRYRCGASRDDPMVVSCPNCSLDKRPNNTGWSNESPFSGDRIIVSKFAYDISNPERWDVIVFKFPGNAKQNYIKRLVGLPNELLKVWRGNVYVTPLLFKTSPEQSQSLVEGEISKELRAAFAAQGVTLGDDAIVTDAGAVRPFDIAGPGNQAFTRRIENGDDRFLLSLHEDELHVYRDDFQILRKPAKKQLAMLQCVHDSQYVNEKLHAAGWPYRWRGEAWSTKDGRSYATDGGDDVQWLSYRQLTPDAAQWSTIEAGGSVQVPEDAPGELITDHYAYNFPLTGNFGRHWVCDLAVEATVTATQETKAIWLDLVRAGNHYRCRFDLKTGSAELGIAGNNADAAFLDGKTPQAKSGVQGAGSYRLRLANVDNQVRVWVNGSLLEFDASTQYSPPAIDAPQWSPTDPGDTEPARIGSEGALQVKRMRILRDIYYVAVNASLASVGVDDDFSGDIPPMASGVANLWKNPEEWLQMQPQFAKRSEVTYALGSGEYFPMGDNSPHSEDARRWSGRGLHTAPHYVNNELLIGKAMVIYWPHHWRPFWPNFKRMGVIR